MQNEMTVNMPLGKNSTKKSLGREVTSLAELVTKQIRESIIRGEYVPGQRLKEEELCRMFDISRPPIREAFKTLEANGILVHTPRKGVFVSEFSADDVEEVYTIIAMLYNKTTDMAMDVISDNDIAQIKTHLDKMIQAVESEPHDVREYQLAHGDFHQTIIELAGNRRIMKLEREMRDLVFIFSYTSFQKKDHLEASLKYHVSIYEAIRERDKEKALRLMDEHVQSATNVLVEKLMKEEKRLQQSNTEKLN